MANSAPYLESERLKLMPLGLEHLSIDYVKWMNDPEIIAYLETGGDYTIEKLKEFLTQIEKYPILFWAIHLKSTNKHIGNIKIDPVNLKHKYGEYGIMMGDKAEWGKGFAKEASQLVISYCFAISTSFHMSVMLALLSIDESIGTSTKSCVVDFTSIDGLLSDCIPSRAVTL